MPLYFPRMRHRPAILPALTLAGLLVGLPTTTMADIVGVTNSPKKATVTAQEGRKLDIRWIISTDPAHQTGASSDKGTLRDTTTNTELLVVNTPLAVPTGSGPLHFSESLTLTPQQLKQWRDLGYRNLEYRREFKGTDTPPTASVSAPATATAASANSASTGVTANRIGTVNIVLFTPETELTENLVIQNLELAFKPQRFSTTVPQNLPLHVQLNVRFTGLGTLNGSWQVARYDQASHAYQYQQLARTNRELEQRNQDFLLSPRLPTDELGKYIVRFCPDTSTLSNVDQATTDDQCPDSQMNASLEYEVIKDKSAVAPPTEEESYKQPLNAATTLSWKPVENAVVYELMIEKVAAKDAVTSNEFTGRMLVACDQFSTQLLPALLARLIPGTQYTWQINAFASNGELIQHTAPKTFVFLPNTQSQQLRQSSKMAAQTNPNRLPHR